MSEHKIIYLIKIDEGDYVWSDDDSPSPDVQEGDVTKYFRHDIVEALQRKVEELEKALEKTKGYDQYSDSEGDFWYDCPDDCEFVEGKELGEVFELLACQYAATVKFVVTKVPDEVDDDYEVKPLTAPRKNHEH